jgi:hypothetical protein
VVHKSDKETPASEETKQFLKNVSVNSPYHHSKGYVGQKSGQHEEG